MTDTEAHLGFNFRECFQNQPTKQSSMKIHKSTLLKIFGPFITKPFVLKFNAARKYFSLTVGKVQSNTPPSKYGPIHTPYV